jgi:SAM-dependent methyltransferase
MQKREMQFYDQEKVWEIYDNNDEERKRVHLTISLIPQDVQRVLDIGCGPGHITNSINKEHVIGVDFAKIPLKYVKKHAIQGSIDALPIKPDQFDLILVTEVLEHLDNEHYQRALEEMRRLNSTYLLISVPYKEDLRRNVARCQECDTLFHLSHHCRSFDESSFEQMFPDYTIIKTEYCTYFYPMNSLLAEIKQKLGVYDYSETAICTICGGAAIRPNIIARYGFGGLDYIGRRISRICGRKKAFHQVVLLKRK